MVRAIHHPQPGQQRESQRPALVPIATTNPNGVSSNAADAIVSFCIQSGRMIARRSRPARGITPVSTLACNLALPQRYLI